MALFKAFFGGGGGGVSDLNSFDTDDLDEGVVNLYFTNARADARADSRISAAIGVTVQAFNAFLSALAGLGGTGIVVKTGAGTSATRSLTAPAAGFTIGNPDGVAGNPLFALSDDLAALEGMASTGLVSRTAANTYAQRTLAVVGTNASWANAAGIAGDPTLTLTYREVLTANRTYYVRTDGSDSNTGLVDSAGGAFLTPQKAVDVVSTLDISTFTATVQIRDGTYTAPVLLKDPVGSGSCILQGNTTAPANVLISITSSDILAGAVNAFASRKWSVTGVKVQTTTAGNGVFVPAGSILSLEKVDYGACATFHMWAREGGVLYVKDSYAVTGAAAGHRRATGGARIVVTTGRTITFTGTQAYSSSFANISLTSYLEDFGNTYTGGTITGSRYTAASNSVINTNGGGANYFPGDAAGTSVTGGQYI